MCGITGFWNFRADESAESLRDRISRMTNSMFRRGPDSGGIRIDTKAGLALGHRRLSIIDLSSAGHQPMATADGRFVICYNGEVYNHLTLRAELESLGIRFRGHSDTETLLHGCALLGVEETVKRLTGMFAFAFLDNRERRLTLVRDRMGVKPLYWGKRDNLLIFGSELKPLTLHGEWHMDINREAVAGLMDTCYIPAPLSIYEGIHKLRPGHLLEIRADGSLREHCWWDPLEVLVHGRQNRLQGDEHEMIDRLDDLLRDAVKSRMVADVPLGAFLSGGVDSSTVAALMQIQSDRPIKTFSIGFEEEGYNEAPFAKAVAGHLGTDHTEEYMTAGQAMGIIPQLASFYDEPFADSSQLPTYLLSRLTRKHVTTALSGDGGDEIFCGYTRYFDCAAAYGKSNRPLWQRSLILSAAALPEEKLNRLARLLPAAVRPSHMAARIKNFAARFTDPAAFYRASCLRHWQDPASLVIGAKVPQLTCVEASLNRIIPDILALVQFIDTVNYLPDDILVKVDRASMAVSLEARVPLLDHRIYEFVQSLPAGMLTRGGESKYPLRRVLYRYVPRDLIERPKMGFGVPIDHWLRGPLREWAESLLEPDRLRREGYLEPDVVCPILQKHLAGEDYQYWLWDVIMFQAWLEHQRLPADTVDAPLAVVYAA
ncbi:MAG: asparagine synthase (glutamine-hydrolyzing) [Desulfovibrio sp.]|jgi:asparagine synthase (glutamine-hydrolysing)|nr:asparagine synthase (glutamine-hydrolyzing) [Desulfovibrio sp.]